MTRNNRDRSTEIQSPTGSSTNDNIMDLPDLSTFRNDEKQHILDVLQRDENLRSKHLSRFMNLRKEVAELEQQSQPTSTSICARCQIPFGYIFNTGDTCPKCGAKVCKQCRLMYNVHDNGWLCQLCCKQMQLMSYSGEWVYANRSNLRNNSIAASQMQHDSLPLSISPPTSLVISSSDSKIEEIDPTSHTNNRFHTQLSPHKLTKSKKPNSNNKIDKMIVQRDIDEQKLNFIKEHMKRRPVNTSFTQPLPRRTDKLTPTPHTRNSSSDEVKSLLSQSNNRQGQTSTKQNPPIPKNIEILKPNTNENQKIEPIQQEVDVKSITTSELADDAKKSKRNKLKVPRSSQPSTRDSKLSLASITRRKLSGKNLSVSMQNLRDTVHRISHPHQSLSRTSLNSEKKDKPEISSTPIINDEDTISLQIPDVQSISNFDTNSEVFQPPVDEPERSSNIITHQESSNILVSTNSTELQPKQRLLSTTYSTATSEYNRLNRPTSVGSRETIRTSRTASVGNRESVVDSDDDIDGTFEKAKLDTNKRTSSFLDIRGSQLSLNSAFSESKAHYGLDISGTIELKLSYNIKTGSLDILIQKCTNLARAKRNQTSNPYCKTYLLPDPSKRNKLKTAVQKHTTDPVFRELLRYRLNAEEFNSRTIWISVWSQTSLGRNDFLGEIHIPLANCTLDTMKEYTLLPRMQRDDIISNIEPTAVSPELHFELTFVENPKNKELGTIQINGIQGKGIYYGKHNVDAICKGILMPDKIKRKLPTTRKGPSPKWDIPLRWEDVRRKNLKNNSIEISIWCQERFRKTMIGFIRLNSSQEHIDDKSVKWLDATNIEISAWELFLKNPTKIHHCQLPLRPATNEK